MEPQNVVDYFGGITQTARALDISYQAVRKWIKSGEVPIQRQYQIQVITDGELEADSPAAA
jgi:predicted site-specific integrase-resolvase